MLPHPTTQIDFRPYAGQHVIIACAAHDHLHTRPTYYVLGTVQADVGLPAHVLAIVADDAYECSELLFVVLVEADGGVRQWMPLVVFDDEGRLRYGYEVLQAIVASDHGSPCYTIRGVHVPSTS
jgi:hypothetical protein